MAQPIALTIAGSDPSGGAGIQADLKVFHQHRIYGASVITLLTVQNTKSVSRVQVMEPELVAEQLDAVTSDLRVNSAKTGALGSVKVIERVADAAAAFTFPLIVDPVMISKHGSPLMEPAAVEVMIAKLLPAAFLVTPNLSEAERITGQRVSSLEDMRAAAVKIRNLGSKHVLIKGGHLHGTSVDLLLFEDEFLEYPAERIETRNTHGTGCVFSAAITANLARGLALPQAVECAKKFVTEAIRTNPEIGSGWGPTNMFSDID